jgi:hypothetical protein
MFCPGCKTLCDEDTIFCGDCGRQIAPLRARGATVAEPVGNLQASALKHNTAYRSAIPRRPAIQMPPQKPRSPFSPPPFRTAQTPVPARSAEQARSSSSASQSGPILPPHDQNRYLIRNIFISFLLILLVAGASAGLMTLAHNKGNNANANANSVITGAASGLVSFSDSQNGQGLTNALTLKISGLGVPPKNLHYYGWIVDAASEKTLGLGMLVAQGKNFGLTFADKNNLLAAGNELEVTQEPGSPMFPTGEVVLSGTLPPLALIHIRHLLVHFDTTPGKIGLLVGLRNQTRLLNTEAELLKSFANDGPDKIGCMAQSIVNVIEGKSGRNAQPLADTCGTFNITDGSDGFGLLNPGNPNAGYIVLSAEHASLAATQSDSTNVIRMHAQHVQAATTDLRKWITIIDQEAQQLVAHPNNTTLIPEIALLTEHALNGVDNNDDGQIDPIVGEAGAIIAYNEGQMMAQLTLGQGL